MSFTKLGYPAAFASEGNPIAGEFDPYVHGIKDTMDVDDDTGVFSLDVSGLGSVLRMKLISAAHGSFLRARNCIYC